MLSRLDTGNVDEGALFGPVFTLLKVFVDLHRQSDNVVVGERGADDEDVLGEQQRLEK